MAAVLDSAEDYEDFVNCRRLFVDLQGDHAKHTILIETQWIIECVGISLEEIAMISLTQSLSLFSQGFF